MIFSAVTAVSESNQTPWRSEAGATLSTRTGCKTPGTRREIKLSALLSGIAGTEPFALDQRLTRRLAYARPPSHRAQGGAVEVWE